GHTTAPTTPAPVSGLWCTTVSPRFHHTPSALSEVCSGLGSGRCQYSPCPLRGVVCTCPCLARMIRAGVSSLRSNFTLLATSSSASLLRVGPGAFGSRAAGGLG